eukprot:1385924-Lingulodinium_polyedra.AAC.1
MFGDRAFFEHAQAFEASDTVRRAQAGAGGRGRRWAQKGAGGRRRAQTGAGGRRWAQTERNIQVATN